MANKLTEMQQRFLDVLFEDAGGEALVAKKLAGYSDNVSTTQVLKGLETELEDAVRKHISRSSLKAAFVLGDAMANPHKIGVKEAMKAAVETLDRAGFTKTTKIDVTTDTPLFILPAKLEEDEDGD